MRDQELTHPDDRQSDVDAAWRILRGELSTLAVREALRAPGRRGRLDAGQPDVPARRVRPPAVLGRPVPGHHRAAPDGLARPADRCAQPARVRHRTRALRGLRAPGRAARARPRRLQGDQRRPRPSRRRRVAARDRGRDRRAGCAAATCWRGSAATSSPCCCPGCEMDHAARVARRHRRAGRRAALRLRRRRARRDHQRRARAASTRSTRPAAILSAADRAMYAAKAVGGGRVRGHSAL